MQITKIVFSVVLGALALSACDSDNDDAGIDGPLKDLEGVNLTLRNTLEEDGPETAFPTLFSQAEDAFDETATLSFSGSEFPTALAQPDVAGGISGLYNIDIGPDSITFTLLPAADDPFWVNIFGVFPAGKFDRYYITFAEPHGITSATSSNSSVSLRVNDENVVVVEITEDYDMNPGISFNLDLN